MQSRIALWPGVGAAVFSILAALASVQAAEPMGLLARSVVQENPEIAAQRQQVRIAKARVAAAEAAMLPGVEANALAQRRKIDVKRGGVGDAKFTAGEVSLTARLRVFDGDRTLNAIRIAKQEEASAEATLDATISDILLDLLTFTADVQRDRRVRGYSEQQREAIAEQLRATARRLSLGEATRTDENLAKARLATSDAGLLSAAEAVGVSGNNFRLVSGRPATETPPLPALASVPGSLDEALSRARVASPRLIAARRNSAAGKLGVNFATGALFPQLDGVAGYEYLTGGVANLFTGELPNDRSAAFGGLELRVPIFQPRDYAEIRRARAARDQRLAQEGLAERTIEQEVSNAWARWQAARQTIETARRAVAETEKAAEGLRKESIGGNRTLIEVLDAQNELLAVRVTLERALRNEFVARANLLAATGALVPQAIFDSSAPAATNTPSEQQTNPNRPAESPLGARVIVAQSPPSEAPAPAMMGSRPAASPLGQNR